MAFPGVSTADEMLFRQNTSRTKNNGIEMSQAFYDIARFDCFTELTLFKCAFNIIHKFNGASFLLAVMVEGDESSRLRMAN